MEESLPTEPEEKPEEYVPPRESWRLPVFIEASLDDVAKTLVDCSSCPVNLLCSEGEGGTGYVCKTCGNTGVWIDEPSYGKEIPKDILILDCAKHKFNAPEKNRMTKCAICSGGIMQLEVLNHGARNHVVFTVHAKVSVAERQKTLREAWAKWKKHYDDAAAAAAVEDE